ncbi:N-acetyldiaminopimelate deacetylase [Fervidibacillus albus]|uniref:N-acetyldiaminopimelate deacetylase n=1 Tax=Fervidibacillus albus TaxID=2980026 RepID=A0A9E8RVW8_9BACI|nr:N-acetyldiaminopimelate deacetylase [Fervidibacillus albus]WAA11115.1 N-acetyldiaminopimelate deacetylase [Fervidibacillus albus]
MEWDWVQIRRDLHQIPELGFQEWKTQAYLLDKLETLPKNRIEIQRWKTGLIVKVNGLDPKKRIGYRTDIDGLPIEEDTGLSYRSVHPGKMHACGHDIHMTIALGALYEIVNEPVADDVVFIFQPAEEGPGGAKPMLESSSFQKWQPDLLFALHIAPEYPVGTVAVKEGLLFANTSELFIDLVGKGGHAAYPHKSNDMVIALTQLVNQLQTIVSRNIDPLDHAVVSIGKIRAGSVQNSIAEEARLEGTIRTFQPETMALIKERIESIVKGIEYGFRCEATIDYGSNYYQVFNDEMLTKQFIELTTSLEDVTVQICTEAMTGEDFGYFLKEIPGFMFWLGANSRYGLHHRKLTPDEACIDTGIHVVTNYIRRKSEEGMQIRP